MTRRLHQPNRIVEFAKRKDSVSQRADLTVGEGSRDLAQQFAGEFRSPHWQLVDVDREIGNILAQRPHVNATVEVEVSFSELEETAKGSEDLEAPLHRLAAQRIEHDIDALSPGDL